MGTFTGWLSLVSAFPQSRHSFVGGDIMFRRHTPIIWERASRMGRLTSWQIFIASLFDSYSCSTWRSILRVNRTCSTRSDWILSNNNFTPLHFLNQRNSNITSAGVAWDQTSLNNRSALRSSEFWVSFSSFGLFWFSSNFLLFYTLKRFFLAANIENMIFNDPKIRLITVGRHYLASPRIPRFAT